MERILNENFIPENPYCLPREVQSPYVCWLKTFFSFLLVTFVIIFIMRKFIIMSFFAVFPRAQHSCNGTTWKSLIFGHLASFGAGAGHDDSGFKWRVKQIAEKGAHVMRFFSKEVLVVYKPELVNFLGNLDQSIIEKSPTFKKIFDPTMKEGIIFQEGEKWKQNRKLFEPYTHINRLRTYHTNFKSSTNQLIEKWNEMADSGESFTIDQTLQSLTLNTFMKSLLGIDFNLSENDQTGLSDAFLAISQGMSMPKTFTDVLSQLPIINQLTPTGRRLVEARKTRSKFIKQILDESAKSESSYFLANQLLKHGLPYDEIAAHVFTFLLAGHETNKSTLIWMLYELGKRPDLQEDLFREVEELRLAGQSYADVLNTTMHENQTLLSSFVSEVQRFYCVAPEIVPRTLLKSVTLPTGEVLPTGSTFMIGIWEAHHNPYTWNRPEVFNPRRFLEETIQPSQFIPFSAGQRRCIGYKYALVQLRTVLTLLVENFKIETDLEHQTEMTRIMTMNPSNGVKIKLTRR